MNDRFVDHATYSKRSIDMKKVENKQKYDTYMKIYSQYAKAVNIANVNDNFKNIVDDFRKMLEIPANKRLNLAMKQSWIDYYNRNK